VSVLSSSRVLWWILRGDDDFSTYRSHQTGSLKLGTLSHCKFEQQKQDSKDG
jgi:hypothetical protein